LHKGRTDTIVCLTSCQTQDEDNREKETSSKTKVDGMKENGVEVEKKEIKETQRT
jgi:hypothetical protein